MKDELLVALENRLRIGARRIDPEFQHATGTGERAGNPSLALDLSGIPDVDDHDVVALRSLDGVRGTYGFDLRIGLVEQRLDAAVDGLGHFVFPRLCKSPLLTCPGRGAAFFTMHRRAGTAADAVLVLASALQRTAYALRSVRGTYSQLPHQFLHRAFKTFDRD